MYFLRGSLPWQGLKAATNKQKYEKIGEKKQQVTVSELCSGFPDEFGKYLTYARHLKFEENPDYDYLLKLFSTVMKKHHLVDDQIYDWMQFDGSKSAADMGGITVNHQKNHPATGGAANAAAKNGGGDNANRVVEEATMCFCFSLKK